MNIIKDSKVLIILGNGHNLALGLRTSYADFGKLYIKQMIKFSESKLCNDLVKSYYSAPQSWNNLEQKIKEFALSTAKSKVSLSPPPNSSNNDKLLATALITPAKS